MREIINELQILDLCSGIGGFHVAAEGNPLVSTVHMAEIDPYCKKHIDQNLNIDNAGSVKDIYPVCEGHPDFEYMEKDLVPVEHTGLSSISMEDVLHGVVSINAITAGSPCQQVSPLNTLHNSEGINGEDSSLIHDVLDLVEDFDVDYFFLENHALIKQRGLTEVVKRLLEIDPNFIIEYETVAATAVGFPHYRHRLYLVAYKNDTPIAKSGKRVFDPLRRMAKRAKPNDNFPIPTELTKEELKDMAVVENPRSIKLRTKRLNGIGNSILPAIPKKLYNGITSTFKKPIGNKQPKPRKNEQYVATFTTTGLRPEQQDFFASNKVLDAMPPQGYIVKGELFSGEINRELNPKNTTFSGLMSTPHKRDGNNNFSPSRIQRPGKMGGVVGDVMLLTGVSGGGLNPIFSEQLMGYPQDFTKLPQH